MPVVEGEKVLMFLGAPNRHPSRRERPEEYNIARSTTPRGVARVPVRLIWAADPFSNVAA
jgi:hypothetical protein